MKSWRTTITGCLAAVANALIPLLKTGSIDPQTLIISAALAILGVLAKDFNVSGGQ